MPLNKVPQHLKKYVVDQNYARYTPEDQAVWRFILRQLKDFLSLHAHSCYVEGLKRTGIEIESIPRIDEMNNKLAEFGWGAVPVSGFIPPAAFMEFQSLGILPIASDMRSIDHLTYTPAPDIVHEAAGHAPILINSEFAAYLKHYAEVARNAIISKQDLDQYEAIRELSDVKENPESTPEDIERAERHLNQVNAHISKVSEAGWLSRMNWWTAEYGLIGSLNKPKIFGAGLLSSVGESRQCLSSKVQKVPLSISCIDVSYDITEPQPQLFVAEDFGQLHSVLDEMSARMGFRLGGVGALERAREAQSVTTTVLDSGIQISGVLSHFDSRSEAIDFVRCSGPTALAFDGHQLSGHGRDYHSQGFSSPIGRLKGLSKPLFRANEGDLNLLGIVKGKKAHLIFESGIEVIGEVTNLARKEDVLIIVQFKNCTVRQGSKILFQPDWGPFDLAVGDQVVSVFGGPADRASFGETEDFHAARVPTRKISTEQAKLYQFFSRIRDFRKSPSDRPEVEWRELAQYFQRNFPTNWLMGIELVELVFQMDLVTCSQEAERISHHLKSLSNLSAMQGECVQDGLRVADIVL